MKKRQSNYGTRQWATNYVNCCTGCSHDCLYCYAKAREVHRFKRMTKADWPLEKIRMHEVKKKRQKMVGRIMLPTTHDITPNNLDACMIVLEKLLRAGNDVLIVSKPHLDCIRAICDAFGHYRDLFEIDEYGCRQYRMLFRFSIGACDDAILSYWEPGAPLYSERKASLKYSYERGFQTSVSAEPMLDSPHIDTLISDLSPFVTDSIWIGKMNHLGRFKNVSDQHLRQEINRIELGQTDTAIKAIYRRYKNNPMIKWKDSIQKVVGI